MEKTIRIVLEGVDVPERADLDENALGIWIYPQTVIKDGLFAPTPADTKSSKGGIVVSALARKITIEEVKS